MGYGTMPSMTDQARDRVIIAIAEVLLLNFPRDATTVELRAAIEAATLEKIPDGVPADESVLRCR